MTKIDITDKTKEKLDNILESNFRFTHLLPHETVSNYSEIIDNLIEIAESEGYLE